MQQNEGSMLDDKYINNHDYEQQNINLRDTLNHVIGVIGVKAFGDFTNLKNDVSNLYTHFTIPNTGTDNKDKINNTPNNTNVTKSNTPSQYGISQNYPNPFNPVTKIDYQLPFASNVSIILYDLTGREVTELVNVHQDAGNYTIQFNGMNLSSGVYFYKIDASNGSQSFEKTLKMILTK